MTWFLCINPEWSVKRKRDNTVSIIKTSSTSLQTLYSLHLTVPLLYTKLLINILLIIPSTHIWSICTFKACDNSGPIYFYLFYYPLVFCKIIVSLLSYSESSISLPGQQYLASLCLFLISPPLWFLLSWHPPDRSPFPSISLRILSKVYH